MESVRWGPPGRLSYVSQPAKTRLLGARASIERALMEIVVGMRCPALPCLRCPGRRSSASEESRVKLLKWLGFAVRDAELLWEGVRLNLTHATEVEVEVGLL